MKWKTIGVYLGPLSVALGIPIALYLYRMQTWGWPFVWANTFVPPTTVDPLYRHLVRTSPPLLLGAYAAWGLGICYLALQDYWALGKQEARP